MSLFTPAMQSSATLSPCGKYRYRLERRWGEGNPCTFIMLNPSTADAEQDDPTIRRCIGFAKREGYGALVVVNLFAYRATNPLELAKRDDPIGPDNDLHLLVGASYLSTTIAAWGAHAMAMKRGVEVAHYLAQQAIGLKCLGVTKSGAPRHPLYVKSDAPLIDYPPAVEPRR